MANQALFLTKNTRFEEAIALLDKNGNGVLPVIGNDGFFVGLITDGDIRKAILNRQLDLEHIINKNPYKLNVESSKTQRIQYLKKIRRRHLPLVDSNNKFVTVFTLDDVDFNRKLNSVVIMAGGLGSRLGELTKDTPKPMLHVGKKPILETIIERFIEFGFSRFYLSVNYKKEVIKEYFQDGKKWGVEISYIEEDKRLGTGGALSLIEEKFSEPIIVTNGDVLTSIDFDELLSFHSAKKSYATMCVREYEHIVPYGVIDTSDDKIISLSEKPKIKFNINTGIYVLNPDVLSRIPKDEYYDMPSLFTNLIETGISPHYYQLVDYWIDIGRVEEFERAQKDFD